MQGQFLATLGVGVLGNTAYRVLNQPEAELMGMVARLPWPDLVVAAAITGLFLHSAWSIISDARADLRQAQ